MSDEYEPVIGLEIHAELQTLSKMFCACPVVDLTESQPNTSVCPVCAGMPGVLPVVNQKAVEYALRVALALECEISLTSIFARKNYFYPDLPKGYQISQYEQPLARHGRLMIQTSQGERLIRIRRVHMEEDTGKLTHVTQNGASFSLVDLNRAGIPLLEIVTEPDLHSAEEVRAYAQSLRSILRYLGVNSGDMQKGVMRIEPNISVRPKGSQKLGTRTEIKNLNSFRALERAVDYEIQRHTALLRSGQKVLQETVGWDVEREVTFTQRVKEGEEDYRYFPEPDLPPLVLEKAWVDDIQRALPELPAAKLRRFEQIYALNRYDAGVLVAEQAVANYFEAAVAAGTGIPPKMIANWIMGELYALLNQADQGIETSPVTPAALVGLLMPVTRGEINNNTAKAVLAEMFASGQTAQAIIQAKGLQQVSDLDRVAGWVRQVLGENPDQVATYLGGKDSISRWLFGQVMRLAKGQANPQIVQAELDRQLAELKR
jgi:aspartyl-tRNA(Asn)/glutamyl-tRNA(Gln) amidotransferase subunit B